MLSRGELEKGGSEEAWPAWKLPECLSACLLSLTAVTLPLAGPLHLGTLPWSVLVVRELRHV